MAHVKWQGAQWELVKVLWKKTGWSLCPELVLVTVVKTS
jgi:hypothetical protein